MKTLFSDYIELSKLLTLEFASRIDIDECLLLVGRIHGTLDSKLFDIMLKSI